jgi:hypothetical protein
VLNAFVPAILIVLVSCPGDILAQNIAEDHIVSSQTLQKQVEASSAARQKNVETLSKFMSTPTAEKAMRDAKIDPVQVRTAIPTLSDSDLANLSSRAKDAQQKFSAGALTQNMLVLIIILIAVIIIVAIVH